MAKKNKYKDYNLNMNDLAKMFSYSSGNTIAASSRRDKFIKGIDLLISHIENQILERISEQLGKH